MVTSGSAKFCEFCGAELPVAKSTHRIASPDEIRKGQIERLDNHPELESILASPPSVTGHSEGFGCGLAGVLIPLVALIAFAIFFLKVSGGGPPGGPPAFRAAFTLVPLIMIGLAFLGILKSVGSASSFESSPLTHKLGVVVDERVEVTGGGENRSATTHYFATIEDGSGTRNEFKVTKDIAAKVSPGDAGVAWVKGSVLVGFKRVVL